MRSLLLVLPLLGCVSMEQRAANSPTTYLCYASVAGTPQGASVASQELARRGHACSDRDVAIGQQQRAQEQQNANASAIAGAALLTAPRPAPNPVVNCTSRTVNGQTYTTCQ